jgi:large subunit ribosomal protein L35
MPKMKTDKGAAKRVKITGTGRLRRLQQNNQHGFEKMSSRRTRRLTGEVDFSHGDERRIKRMLGM